MNYKIMTNEPLIENAVNQIEEMVKMFDKERTVVMPDYHAGKGSVVGTTMHIDGRVNPNIVGVDIGCGILAYDISESDVEYDKIDAFIRSEIPTGHRVHKEQAHDINILDEFIAPIDKDRAEKSLGTLGGGNHFIEIGEREYTKKKCIFIHTGSRKLGVEVCKFYEKVAINNKGIEFEKRKFDILGSKDKTTINKQLKELSIEFRRKEKEMPVLDGEAFESYIHDMKLATEYARLNREYILKTILGFLGLEFEERRVIDTKHNYIGEDNILRKGAISAYEGEVVVIPLNMKEGVALCVGKGNPEWNYSAPHGCGRYYSRSEAKKRISLEEFENSMKNIATSSVVESTIDEAPMAYKDSNAVLEKASETVQLLDIFKTVYNFKDK